MLIFKEGVRTSNTFRVHIFEEDLSCILLSYVLLNFCILMSLYYFHFPFLVSLPQTSTVSNENTTSSG